MGLTIHYSNGKAKTQAEIDDCLGFLEDTAKRLPCRYDLIDEKLTGVLSDIRHKNNPDNGKIKTVRQKGILLWLDEGSEPLTFSFDYDTLEFCNYLQTSKGGELSKWGLFCKTQFAKNFLKTHHTACKLLETVKQKYIRGLMVHDEAEYYGKWDKEQLLKTYEEWSGLIDSFGKALKRIEATSDIEQDIQTALNETHKDYKLKKLFS